MIALNTIPAYRKFVHDRNLALEAIFHRAMLRLNANLARALDEMAATVARGLELNASWREIGEAIQNGAYPRSHECTLILQRMRKSIYLLSVVGEAEAIARATGKAKYHLSKLDLVNVAARQAAFGGSLLDRMELAFQRIVRRVTDAVHVGQVNSETTAEILDRVRSAFPKGRIVSQHKRLVRNLKLQEADINSKPIGQGLDMSTGFVDDDEWESMVEDYLDEAGLIARGGEIVRRTEGELEGESRTVYDWEVEREATHDFVEMVRQGQVDAANENGYTDFVWIAVIDNKTDECCLWRDGLLISEIEVQLNGAHSDDECEGATTPPAHVSCRCDISPVTDAIQDFETPPIGDFEEWLTT